ncbi:Thioredoxin domain-containing protein 9-like protein [Dirofilaria immitis]|nr:Thioredoxin domain-containing protein 9-like protein [Dirofilaria immitis]
MEKVLGEQLLKAVTIAEKEVDRQIEKYDNLDENDLEAIRQKRLEELKRSNCKGRQRWLQNGHGIYEEISDERNFSTPRKSLLKLCVIFIYPLLSAAKLLTNIWKKLLGNIWKFDLFMLMLKRLESSVPLSRFPFLTTRLKIRVIPTIVIIIDAKTVDYIRGFDDLGGIDEFRTETLEWRLSWTKVLEYDGPSFLRSSRMTVSKLTKEAKKK